MCLAPFRVRQLPLVPVSFRSVKLGHFDSHSCIVVVQWTHRGFRRWWGSWPTTAAVTTLYRHYPPPLSPVEHFLGLSVVPSSLVRNTFNSIKALCIFVITGLEVFWKSGGTRGMPATKNKNVCVCGPVYTTKTAGFGFHAHLWFTWELLTECLNLKTFETGFWRENLFVVVSVETGRAVLRKWWGAAYAHQSCSEM